MSLEKESFWEVQSHRTKRAGRKESVSGMHNNLESVMAQNPRLNSQGMGVFGLDSKLTVAQLDKCRIAELAKCRLELRSAASLQEFENACRWLQAQTQRQIIARSRSSHGLKFLAEKEIGPIGNGAFIAAGIACGFAFKAMPDSPNVFFSVSRRTAT